MEAMLGRALPFTVGCLFIPVARGSPLLRIIDVPFEQAIKYHRWMGYLTAILVAIHGGGYAVAIGMEHKLHLVRHVASFSATLTSFDAYIHFFENLSLWCD